jgi:Spy/CpxP family protein refolding chaperone
MNSSLRWKLVVAYVLVFLAGAASGFLGATHLGIFVRHPPSGAIAEHMKQHLRNELKLTPKQIEQISPIVDHATSSLETKREQTAREVRAIFQEMHSRISPLLTAEQRARLEQMEQRHRAMMVRHRLGPPSPD